MMKTHDEWVTEQDPSMGPGEVSDDEWDQFVAGQDNGHLLQTSHWARFKGESGWEHERVVILEGRTILAGASILYRRLPLGLRLAYVPKGPVGVWTNPRVAAVLFDEIHKRAQLRGAFMMKVEPESPGHDTTISTLRDAGFLLSTQTIQPRSTIWVDLAASVDEIRSRMKGKTRYNIGLSQRKEVIVWLGTHDDLPAFYRLMEETGRRDGFSLHSPSYYERAFRLLSPIGACTLFLASYGGRILAGLMAFSWGQKAWYMYGASSDQERGRMPNYALQWAAIIWAREKGCRLYDLWGIPEEVGREPERYNQTVVDRTDGLWSVYRFKQGFGGQVVHYAGAFDYIYDPLQHAVYSLALKLRRFGQVTGDRL